MHLLLPRQYELILLERVDDVVSEAGRRAESGAEEGTFVVALEQSDAHTRSGALWFSPAGNAHCAIVLRPDFSSARIGQLAYVTALSVGAALAGLLSPMTGLHYRWPNRILLNGLDAGRVMLAGPARASDPMPWLVVRLDDECHAPPGESRAGGLQQRARQRISSSHRRSVDRGLFPALPCVDKPLGGKRIRADRPGLERTREWISGRIRIGSRKRRCATAAGPGRFAADQEPKWRIATSFHTGPLRLRPDRLPQFHRVAIVASRSESGCWSTLRRGRARYAP